MEDKIVILSNLKVKGLYGNYDYNVNFNSDVTLLYGTNGCGKTTILNIISSIITGNLYRLFSYRFNEIRLSYYYEKNKRTKCHILLNKISNDNIKIKFRDNETNIEKIQVSEDKIRRKDSYDEIYFEEYPVLNEIRKEFNFVFLALNRVAALSNTDDFYYMNRRRFFMEEDRIIEPEQIDPEIRYIENLIYRRYMNVTTVTNAINNDFRNSILKSALDVNVQTDLVKFLNDFNLNALKKSDISKIKESYMRILNDLKIISEEEKKQYAFFFEEYSKLLKGMSNESELKDTFALFIAYNEMKKIQGIVGIADETEKQKAKVMRPIELFLDTVNEFISSSDFRKKIEINLNGRVYFKTEDNENNLSIQFLSSGERQLIIFFANLIFGVADTTSGIFVVDEPELSLHLSWQRVFVKKALEVNNNVQFIFATHAPEIIGYYRNKTEQLQRVEIK